MNGYVITYKNGHYIGKEHEDFYYLTDLTDAYIFLDMNSCISYLEKAKAQKDEYIINEITLQVGKEIEYELP